MKVMNKTSVVVKERDRLYANESVEREGEGENEEKEEQLECRQKQGT